MGYCERCGGRYDFEGICEGCGTDEEWSWNAPENRNKVVCEGCGHEIYEARRYCHVCGTKNEHAFKKGEHYCPDCGNAFENGVCPNCGKREAYFLNRKIDDELGFCSKCSEQIHAKDLFCIHCGNENYKNRPYCVVEPRKREEPSGGRKNYCQKCGGIIRFDADLFSRVCNKCKDDDDWTFFDPKHNKNRIKCKNCGEEMFEIRRFCKNCGAENELAFKKADNYCPYCGIAFENGVCPECGKTLEYFKTREIEEKELRYCAVCDKEISKHDYFCLYCGSETYIYAPLEVSKAAEVKEEAKLTAKIPEHLKNTQPAGYSGYYFEELHTTLWLVLGIISLVICCLPTGIGTIICSIGAKRAENELEYDVAKRKTGWAKFWFFLGCAIVASLMVASVVIQVSQM